MFDAQIIDVVGEILQCLARREYRAIAVLTRCERLSADEIRAAVAEYGGNVVEPPTDFAIYLDVLPIQASARVAWSVNTPVWMEDEGLSDLTVELTIERRGNGVVVSLDGLHVL